MQRGTLHRWRVLDRGLCTVIAVLFDADQSGEFLEVSEGVWPNEYAERFVQ